MRVYIIYDKARPSEAGWRASAPRETPCFAEIREMTLLNYQMVKLYRHTTVFLYNLYRVGY